MTTKLNVDQINDVIRLASVAIEDFDVTGGTIGGGSAVDASAALQLAINYCASLGGGTVNCFNPPYKIATLSGNTVTFPASGATMGYCVELKPKVRLRGITRERKTFVGDWTYRTSVVDNTQKIMLRLTDSPGGGSFYLDEIAFSNCMIPMFHSGIITGEFHNIGFSGCALPMIGQQAERFHIDGIDIGGKTAGVAIGGWLTGGTADSGGWIDKCSFTRINYITFDLLFSATEVAIDDFFNTHFYNNGGAGGLALQFPGVVGIPLFLANRYSRGNFNNTISKMFTFGSPRTAVFGVSAYGWDVSEVNMERCGYEDYTYSGSGAHIMGGTGGGAYFADPWALGVGAAGKMPGVITISEGYNSNIARHIYATGSAFILPVSGIINQLGMGVVRGANADSSAPYIPYGSIGALSAVDGMFFPGHPSAKPSSIPIGSGGYGLLGTDAVHVAGTWYITPIFVPDTFKVTFLAFLAGSIVGTDKVVLALYNSTGALLANTDTAGTLITGANAFKEVVLTAYPYAAKGPALFYVAMQCNGTTDKSRRVAGSTYIHLLSAAVAGVFGTVPATITPPTVFTADQAPIVYVR